jgi:hypothetical protein
LSFILFLCYFVYFLFYFIFILFLFFYLVNKQRNQVSLDQAVEEQSEENSDEDDQFESVYDLEIKSDEGVFFFSLLLFLLTSS